MITYSSLFSIFIHIQINLSSILIRMNIIVYIILGVTSLE